ncbi:MAG: hypothetical protein OFPI_43990 [Osedax symbiont Rs2]|nr:MAG: hypothetical protein OFPI_43990 [Osedax symbiont Rs2]
MLNAPSASKGIVIKATWRGDSRSTIFPNQGNVSALAKVASI